MGKKIQLLLSIIAMVGGGVCIGYGLHTEMLDKKIAYCNALNESIKKNNNQFLVNVSHIINNVNGTNGKFTQFDEYLMSLWMD